MVHFNRLGQGPLAMQAVREWQCVSIDGAVEHRKDVFNVPNLIPKVAHWNCDPWLDTTRSDHHIDFTYGGLRVRTQDQTVNPLQTLWVYTVLLMVPRDLNHQKYRSFALRLYVGEGVDRREVLFWAKVVFANVERAAIVEEVLSRFGNWRTHPSVPLYLS